MDFPNDPTASHAILSADEIAALNAARTVLKNIAKRALNGTPEVKSNQADGMVYAVADDAENAVFKVLNWAQSWWHLSLTTAQLYNQDGEE